MGWLWQPPGAGWGVVIRHCDVSMYSELLELSQGVSSYGTAELAVPGGREM